MNRLFLHSAILLLPITSQAQPSAPPVQSGVEIPGSAALSPAQRKRLGALQQLRANGAKELKDLRAAGRAQAVAKLKARDIEGAEDLVTVLNPFEPDTEHWSMDSAREWLNLAEELARASERSHAETAVTRALTHLNDAKSRAVTSGNQQGRVAAHLIIATLHERFAGNPAAALAAYKEALELDPTNEAALEANARLEAALRTLQSRPTNARK